MVHCSALVIVLTQFTRSIYRGTPMMFSGDDNALGITTKAIFRGYAKALPPLQSVFLPCLALTCQENIHCHVRPLPVSSLSIKKISFILGAGGRDLDQLHLTETKQGGPPEGDPEQLHQQSEDNEEVWKISSQEPTYRERVN